jgi:hypothetical protein
MSDLTITTAGVSADVRTGNKKAGIKIKVSPAGLQTSAHTAGDVVFTKIEMPNAVRIKGGTAVIREVVMFVSGAATGDDITLLFFDNSTALGEPNGDPVADITSAEYKASGCISALSFDGSYSVAFSDGRLYRDSSGLTGPGVIASDVYLKAQESSTSMWIAAFTTSGTLDLLHADSIDISLIIEYLD